MRSQNDLYRCHSYVPNIQVLSSTLISLHNSPPIMASLPLSPTLSLFFCMTTFKSLPRVPFGTGTTISTSPNSCLQVYGKAETSVNADRRHTTELRHAYQPAPLPRVHDQPCRELPFPPSKACHSHLLQPTSWNCRCTEFKYVVSRVCRLSISSCGGAISHFPTITERWLSLTEVQMGLHSTLRSLLPSFASTPAAVVL